MKRICPHCNHVRKADEAVPDWQCPACGKAYVKARNSLPSEGFCRNGPASGKERRDGKLKWLVLLVVLAAAIGFGRPLWHDQKGRRMPSAAAAGQSAVVLYATEWCGYCKASREFFADHNISYVEHDIEKSSEALARHRKLGGKGVPLIVVGDEVIEGYNESALRAVLAPWIKG